MHNVTHRLGTSLFLALVLAFLLARAMVLAAEPAAPAAPAGTVITVNTLADELNFDGDCSLREAIRAANLDTAVSGCPAGSGIDTIILPAGVYTLSLAGASEDGGLTGDLDITSTLIISGVSAAATIINGNGAVTNDRVFHIFNSPTVTITGMTIRNGSTVSFGAGIRKDNGKLVLIHSVVRDNTSTGNSAGGILNDSGVMLVLSSTVTLNASATLGAGISNNGALTITASIISANSSTNDRGGGIENRVIGTLTLVNSTVSGNSAATQGGGINNENTATLIDSTISGNDAPDSGGIYSKDTLTIINSTVSGNTAGSAGGIRITGTLTANIVNSTVSGNTAMGGSGGIAVNNGATLNLFNATVTNNQADVDNNGSGTGGGINAAGGTTVNLRNSILAGNTANSGSGPNCTGTLNLHGYNFVNSVSDCTFNVIVGNNVAGNPQLGPLALNGGPNRTHALLPGSLAIDAGNPAGCVDHNGSALATDQRGFPRPTDGDQNGSARCDIGAYEYPAPDVAIGKLGPGVILSPTTAVTYFIRLTNTAAVTVNSIRMTDTYPAGFTGAGFFGTTCPSLNPKLICTLTNVPPNATRSITVVTTVSSPPACGLLAVNNVVADASGDHNAANDAASVSSLIGCPDVAMAKVGPSLVISPANTFAGIQYRFTLTNVGSVTLTNLIVTDNLPGGMILNTMVGVSCADIGVISCTIPSLGIGATKVFTLNTSVATPPPCGTHLVNQATVVPAEGDLRPADNAANTMAILMCKQLFLPLLAR